MRGNTPLAPPHVRVGLTEAHGMAHEVSLNPPDGILYSFIDGRPAPWYLTSPLKGYFPRYRAPDCDIVESVMSPVFTEKPWVYSLACFQEAVAFEFCRVPVPRRLRVALIERLLLRDNCRRLVFWSQAGLDTMRNYGRVSDTRIWAKSTVVYPAVRAVPEANIRFRGGRAARLMFSGTFFIKGGVHVVEAYERLQKKYPDVQLRLCCDPDIDFRTSNAALREEFLTRIRANPGITLGRVSRAVLMNEILPETDVYLLPTYSDAFGFAILEAMACGVPVVSTNIFAIPEMIEHGGHGILLDTRAFDTMNMFSGLDVSGLPGGFRAAVTDALYDSIEQLVVSPDLRRRLGLAARERALTQFSFERRNAQMSAVYDEALS